MHIIQWCLPFANHIEFLCLAFSQSLFKNRCCFFFKQDLSLKCLAWKGFMPHLQWKSPSPKQILGPKKLLVNFGSTQNVGSKNFWVKRNCGSKILFGQNEFWVREKILEKNCGVQKNVEKIFWLPKYFGLNIFLVQLNQWIKDFGTFKNLCSEKNLGSKSEKK